MLVLKIIESFIYVWDHVGSGSDPDWGYFVMLLTDVHAVGQGGQGSLGHFVLGVE